MNKIHLLSEDLINKIAAGEVLENPASCVKELVENSLDASSTEIVVTIKGGGLLLIQVEDNGQGIEPAELPLAIARHATSKINDIQDLETLTTLGFRGEALSSIASVSKMRIESSTGDVGHAIEISAGHIASIGKISRQKGTSIEVKSLFFSTPVRKKFQKSEKANIAQVHRLIEHFALAYPEVQFTLISDERKFFETPLVDQKNFFEILKKRFFLLYPESFCQRATEISTEEDHVRIEGFLGDPVLAGVTQRNQTIFLNRRLIVSSLISQAIEEGYGTRLSEKMHPTFAIHIFLPPSFVDVNVHPQKKHVRFRQEAWIKEKIALLVSKAFQKKSQIFLDQQKSFQPPEKFLSNATWPSTQDLWDVPIKEKQLDFFSEKKVFEEKNFKILALCENLALIECFHIKFFDEHEKGWIVANLEAAYTRTFFDLLLSAHKHNKKVETQVLATPYLCELSSDQMDRFEDLEKVLLPLGFEVQRVAKKTISFEVIPSFLSCEDLTLFIPELIAELLDLGRTELIEKKFTLYFARFARRLAKNKKFSLAEAELVLTKLFGSEEFLLDPFGQHIFATLSKKELEKFFKKEASYGMS